MSHLPDKPVLFLQTPFLRLAAVLAALLPLAAQAQDDSGFKYIEIQVVDPAGKPLADVPIDVKLDGMQFPMPTNAEGKISLNAASGKNSHLQVSVKHSEYVAVTQRWRGGKNIPEQHKIKLETGVPIGGIVQDEQGNPVEGVKVTTQSPVTNPDNTIVLYTDHLATTDKTGRWKIFVKADGQRDWRLRLSHDDYLSDAAFRKLASWEQLQQLDHVFTLEKGLEIRGFVGDEQRNPIPRATVFLGSSRYIRSADKKKKVTTTDDQGNYRFGNVAAGTTLMTVAARGWAPQLRSIVARKQADSEDFVMQPGEKIRISVTDPDGVPIQGVGIAADEWRNHRSLPESIYRGSTNAEGIWQSDSMPADLVKFDLFKRGHMSSRDNELLAKEEAHTIVLPWPLIVSGNVTDKESGLPLEKFTAIRGTGWGDRSSRKSWSRYNQQESTNGKYQLEFTEPATEHFVRIEAEGYQPAVSRALLDDEGEVKIHFEMEAGSGPRGTVKTPDGKPAAGAQLFVATVDQSLYFRNGIEENNRRTPHATADEMGKYQLPFLEESDFVLICLHDTGWSRLNREQVVAAPDVQLTAWSVVEGTLLVGKEPLAGESITLYYNEPYVQGVPRPHWDYQTETDAEGKFRFDRVIGSVANVARSIRFADRGNGGSMSCYSHAEEAKLTPGQTVQLQLGGTGRAIHGQLKLPEDADQNVNWTMGVVQIYEQTPPANTGGFFQSLGRAIAGGGRPAPQQPVFRRNYASAIDSAGKFAIADVVPGTYRMSAQLYPPPEIEDNYWQQIAHLHQSITIPEVSGKNNQDPIDLGEFTLQMVKPGPPRPVNGVLQAIPAAQ